MSSELIATAAAEQLRRWDAGESIWSIEMGGISPRYEQAIQVLAIEIIRDELNNPLPDDDQFGNWGNATVSRLDVRDEKTGKYALGGFSAAQVGATKQIAYRFIVDGPAKALQSAPDDRKIQVSNYWDLYT